MSSLKGALKFALAWEEDAQKRYLSWAKEAININAKKLFENLAKMEERHILIIRGIDLTQDIPLHLSGHDWLDLSHGMSSYPTSGDRQLKSIFEYAMAQEVDAASRYMSLASDVPEGKLRDLFNTLAHEEEYHKTLILEQYNRLLNQY
jgi:rubrerythrin